MKPFALPLPILTSLAALLLSGTVFAQTPAPASSPASLPGISPSTDEPKVEQLRTSDSAVAIDELRVRGEMQKVTVKPKNAPEYEIAPQSAAKRADDRSQGVRTWRIFSF